MPRCSKCGESCQPWELVHASYVGVCSNCYAKIQDEQTRKMAEIEEQAQKQADLERTKLLAAYHTPGVDDSVLTIRNASLRAGPRGNIVDLFFENKAVFVIFKGEYKHLSGDVAGASPELYGAAVGGILGSFAVATANEVLGRRRRRRSLAEIETTETNRGQKNLQAYVDEGAPLAVLPRKMIVNITTTWKGLLRFETAGKIVDFTVPGGRKYLQRHDKAIQEYLKGCA